MNHINAGKKIVGPTNLIKIIERKSMVDVLFKYETTEKELT